MKNFRLWRGLGRRIHRVVFRSVLVIVILGFTPPNGLLRAQQLPTYTQQVPTHTYQMPSAAPGSDNTLLKALLEKMTRLEKRQDELAKKLENLQRRIDQLSPKP